jgi:L-alanine-DL-glutamate epimerase-like enolase superfamily enzyme
MRLSHTTITLHLRTPFRLSYGVSETRQVHWIRLEGEQGWGEAAIPPYYGIPIVDMQQVWDQAAQKTEPFPDDPAGIPAWVGNEGPAPARCALDLALHDRIARNQGLPLFRLLGLPAPAPMPTSFTIAIDTPAEMARLAREATQFSLIKLKLGGDEDDDEARLAAVRAARPDARLRLDANAGWSFIQAERYLQEWQHYDLELVEQPLAKDQIEAMGQLQACTAIPIIADESVQSLADIDALGTAGVRGVNLKLMKLGGLTAGLACLHRARELGMGVMLGSMVETSIGATAMAHLAGAADWLDLDTPLLVKNDPFDGLKYDASGRIHLPERAGIGVILKEMEPA